jgi:hypothetical protein
MSYQQQLEELPVSFVVLSAVDNKLDTLLILMPEVQVALEAIKPGQMVKIGTKPEM